MKYARRVRAFWWCGAAALCLGACLGVETYQERSPARTLQIRMVVSDGQTGESAPRLGARHERIEVSRRVVVDSDHIRRVRLLDAADGSRILVLEVDEVGRARLREASRANIGGRMAIMVEGQVVAAPTVRTALTESEVYVAVPVDEIEDAFLKMGAESSP